MMVTLEAGGTHLYPGARCMVRSGSLPAWPSPQPATCLLVFADGAFAAGLLTARGGTDWLLAVNAHPTGRGSAIPARRWLVTVDRTGGKSALRVRAKLPPA
ncbi:MAG: hypothetical protein ACLGJC_14855 [Alphaproteobacteria bacterium]